MSKLFTKVLIVQLVLFGVTAAAISVLLGWSLYRNLTAEFRSKGTAIARSTSYSAVDTIVKGDLAAVQAVLEQFSELSGVAYVLVQDPAGEIVSHTFIPVVPDAVLRLVSASSLEDSSDSDVRVLESDNLIDVSAPILAGLGGAVHVGMDRQVILSEVWTVILHEQLLVFVLLVSNVGLAFLLLRRISRPLTALAGHARHLAAQGFASEVLSQGYAGGIAASSRDEVGELARSFAYMEDTLKDHIGRLEVKVAERTQELTQKNEKLAHTLDQLRAAQEQIVVQEKLASLGALTAGVAHEIKNPLNFVINFSGLSNDLINDLWAEWERHRDKLEPAGAELLKETLSDLELNQRKINEHGKRADRIVQNMLLHSRGAPDSRVATDINALLEEYVALAYHGLRARDPSFNVTIEKDFESGLPPVEAAPHEIGRVFVNIVSNACYAANEKSREGTPNFSPVVAVSTRNLGDRIEIRIRDNGPGIAPEVREKIFHPFFTTKPPGEGTGLGLSISFDIIVTQHRGELEVESKPGEYAEFIIRLPT